ncbi:two-component system response regulator BtsR [Desulfopila aestuarii]|uniref:Two component transcriptional regulator, LytTR family n=1 Tax=Desulfopila aestuarii DSM 18488 TaxID=1121416 RepID=A0A1M7XVY4_9BACT|nr:two-component system response regulator BtsR [Desulfopila aestuarii]SHO42687.1 two component transcriptional regulator, LytTR family [Desulfopila aestuarii DSM 18488]
MKIRALIIDDELHAREEMEALLGETGAIDLLGSCGNGIEALQLINRLRPEVLFLDIQMPVIDGFELLNMINQEIMPHVVFVTAYDQYSLKAFEEKTLDYLLKPVDSRRLTLTIDKLRKTIGENRPPNYETEAIRRIPCLLGNRIKLIQLGDIEYISTGPAGVHAVTATDEYFTEVTLKVLEERTALLRCHKQYLINIDSINEIVLLEAGLAKIRTHSGKFIPVSRRYLKIIKKKLLI